MYVHVCMLDPKCMGSEKTHFILYIGILCLYACTYSHGIHALFTLSYWKCCWHKPWRTAHGIRWIHWSKSKFKDHVTVCVVCFYRSRLMSSMEDLLFYTITEGQEMIPFSQFISVSHQHFHASSVSHSMDCFDFPWHMWT